MHILKTLTPFKPTKLSGCALWLAADRGVTTVDGKVSAWADQSGNGNHATQSTSADYRPLYVASAQGGKPTVRFDGSSNAQFLKIPYGNENLNLTSDMTIFTVYTGTTSTLINKGRWFTYCAWNLNLAVSTSGPIFGHKELSTTNAVLATSDLRSAWKIVCAKRAGSVNPTYTAYVNGAYHNTNTSNSTVQNSAGYDTYIGRLDYDGNDNSATNRYNGDISEIIIFNRALTDAERIKVEQYLSSKFAITLS